VQYLVRRRPGPAAAGGRRPTPTGPAAGGRPVSRSCWPLPPSGTHPRQWTAGLAGPRPRAADPPPHRRRLEGGARLDEDAPCTGVGGDV